MARVNSWFTFIFQSHQLSHRVREFGINIERYLNKRGQ